MGKIHDAQSLVSFPNGDAQHGTNGYLGGIHLLEKFTVLYIMDQDGPSILRTVSGNALSECHAHMGVGVVYCYAGSGLEHYRAVLHHEDGGVLTP